MESGRGRTRTAAGAAIVACALALSSCTVPTARVEPGTTVPGTLPASTQVIEPESALPDITARAIGPEDLAIMLGDAGTVTDRANEQLVIDAVLDRDDQSGDIVASGRITGAATAFDTAAGRAHIWIDVLVDGAAANHYLSDLAGDIAKGIDGTHDPGSILSDVDEFSVSAGQDAIGLVGSLDDGTTETIILARMGRLVLFTSEVRSDDSDARASVQYIADDALQRMLGTLTGGVIDHDAGRRPGYRFQTVIEVADGTGRWVTEATGVTAESGTSCTVDRSSPAGATLVEIIEVGERRWLRPGGATGFVEAGASAVAAAALIWCPSWPLSVTAAGLGGVEAGAEPQRQAVNGVAATRVQGDSADLAAAVGITPPLLSVESFSFWVADDTEWIVELSLIASGPAEALAPLIGAEFAGVGDVTVSVRHRVLDLDSVDPVVSPG
jgi:hypothetical protein